MGRMSTRRRFGIVFRSSVRRQAESSRAQRMLLVTREDVANVVSQRTGIPVGTLSQTEKERLLALEDALHARVVGQDAAVREVCRAVRRGRSGMADEERPAASMLFAGPTGVGKTELCKALADVVYGSADSLIRIDMSEYMEPGLRDPPHRSASGVCRPRRGRRAHGEGKKKALLRGAARRN